MREIIHDWIFNKTGEKLEKKEISKRIRDGVILAKLLTLYKVANEKAVKFILPSDNAKVCENNLRQLSVWFDILKVKFDDEIISNIANGRTTTCLTLLYELYVVLHDKKHVKLDYLLGETHQIKRSSLTSRLLRRQPCDKQILDSNKVKQILSNRLSCNKIQQAERSPNGNFIEESHKVLKEKNYLHERMRNEDIEFVRNKLKNVSGKTPAQTAHITLPTSQTVQDVVVENQNALNTDIQGTSLADSVKSQEKYINAIEPITQSENVIRDTERNQLQISMTENIIYQSGYEQQSLMDNIKASYQNKLNKEIVFKQLEQKPINYLDYFSTCKTSEEEIAGQLQVIERMELHRKLYDENTRKRNKRRYLMSKQIVNDLVDFAIKLVEQGSITNEIKSQLNQVFISGNPILDDNEISEEPIVINIDEKHSSDDFLPLNAFDDYNHLIGDWYSYAGPDVSHDDLFIIAHIVYRMKDFRRPPKIPIISANIPKYQITSVLIGALDELTVTKLKTLLVKSKVFITDIETAVNFCIQLYKVEEDIKPPEISSKKKVTDKSKEKKKTPKSGTKASRAETVDKEVQTSPSLLENTGMPKVLTAAAKIGQKIYNLQNENKSLNLADVPREYIRDSLIEFIKLQSDITGWVLVNYPSTLEEAYDMEKALTGKKFPHVFHVDDTEEDKQQVSDEYDIQDDMKHSKLVHLPIEPIEKFATYFTRYINVLKQETPKVINTSRKSTNADSESKSIQLEEAEEEEQVIDLNQIYNDQGILRDFFYETMDFNTLKNLARIILQCDDNVNEVPSNEIFGEQVIQYYDKSLTVSRESKGGAKSAKPPASKKTAKGKSELDTVKEFLEQLIITFKAVSASEIIESKEELGDQKEIIEEEFEMEQIPGQYGWNYAEFPITTEDAIILANLWKEMEEVYICQIEEVFYFLWKNEELITLYQNFVYKSMEDVKNDDSSECVNIVKDFVQQFNNALKNDCSTSIPVHTQHKKLSNSIINMERRLWEISEKKRKALEIQRRKIIRQGWTADAMITIFKRFLSLIEIEVNRSNTTLEFLYMYYSFMCSVQTLLINPPRMPFANLSQLDYDECKIRKTVAKILIDKNNNSALNPIHRVLDNVIQYYVTEIAKLQFNIDYTIQTYKDYITCSRNEYERKKIEQANNNINLLKETKRDSTVEEKKKIIPVVFKAKQEDVENMFHEWNAAIKSELNRLTYRMKIIRNKAVTTLDKLENDMVNIFYKIYDEIMKNYLQENKSIDILCNIFHSAIIYQSPIIGEIVADGNCVYIEEQIDVSNTNYDFRNTIDKELDKSCFTIKQLGEVARILKLASNNKGIINRRTLLFLVEDMIAHDSPTKINRLFPVGWKKLNSSELNQLFEDAFGMTSKLYWKDFILYSLDIPQLDTEDIVEQKTYFQFYDKTNTGLITYKDYFTITFWYEVDLNYNRSKEYTESLKEFIFSLYRVKENHFDYIDFLLSFSKGENDTAGFAKALACLSGKCVIQSEISSHLQDILTEYDQLISEMVTELLQEAIGNALNELHGLKLTELPYKADVAASQLTDKSKNSIEGFIRTEIIGFTEKEQEKEEIKQKEDKETQTISLTEFMYHQYVTKNKLYRWTTNVQASLINGLLEDKIYPVLEFQNNFIDTEKLKRDIKASLVKLEQKEEIAFPQLTQEQSFQDLFLCTHMFKLFSFPSAIGNKAQNSDRSYACKMCSS